MGYDDDDDMTRQDHGRMTRHEWGGQRKTLHKSEEEEKNAARTDT